MTHARDLGPFVRELAHTADAGFEVTAPELPVLFERAGLALAAPIADPNGVEMRQTEAVTVAADGLVEVLHDFLAAVLVRVAVDGFLPVAIAVERVDARGLAATLHGERLDPSRHRLHGEVKAVTYHLLAVEQAAGGWRARVIVDV